MVSGRRKDEWTGDFQPVEEGLMCTVTAILRALVWLSSVASTLLGGAAVAAQASRETTTGGVEIHYSVMSADAVRAYPAGSSERSMHGGVPRGPDKRHVMVAVLDAKTKQPINDAIVKARVAELAQAGEEKKLEAMIVAGSVTYGNYFTMKGRGPYRVSVAISRPQFAGAIKASFDYSGWDK
jgi:hypothetical protein